MRIRDRVFALFFLFYTPAHAAGLGPAIPVPADPTAALWAPPGFEVASCPRDLAPGGAESYPGLCIMAFEGEGNCYISSGLQHSKAMAFPKQGAPEKKTLCLAADGLNGPQGLAPSERNLPPTRRKDFDWRLETNPFSTANYGAARRVASAGSLPHDVLSDEKGGMPSQVRSHGENSTPATVTDLVNPESALAGPDGRIYVSQIGEFDTDGDGVITVMDSAGKPQTFAPGLNDPKGLAIWEEHLYVTDRTSIIRVGPDGTSSPLVTAAAFPRPPQFLNDLEFGPDGTLYVSDSGDLKGQGGAIFKISPGGQVTLLVDSASATEIKAPNGLLMEDQNHLLMVDFVTGKLYRIKLKTGALEHINGGFGGGDGLVKDAQGRLYVSDYKNGKVFMLDSPSAAPRLLSEQFQAAADIGLAPDKAHLLVPDMKAGQLIWLPLPR